MNEAITISLITSITSIMSAIIVAIITTKFNDNKFHQLFTNHLHGLSQYLKILNSALLREKVINEVEKQQLDNNAEDICSNK